MKPAEICNPLFFEEAQRPCQESDEVINQKLKSEELVKVFYEVDSLPKGVRCLSMVVILLPTNQLTTRNF